MRFAHISDLHLGRLVDKGTPWEKKASKELFDSFINLIDILEGEKLDFLFISGDLFDHPPTEDELRQVDMELVRLSKTYIIYVTGEADYLKEKTPIWNYKFRSNMFLLNGEEFNNCVPESMMPVRNSYADGIVDSIYFEKYNLDIYGICQYAPKNQRNDLDFVYVRDTKRKNILLLHGGDRDVSPFDLDDLGPKKFDYFAMGHSHSFRCKKEKKLYYPGAPEPLGPEDTGDHGYIKGYMDKDTTSAKFVATAQRCYKTIEVDADERMTNVNLNDILREKCGKDKGSIFSIKINRSANCYTEFNIDALKERYRIIQVTGDKADGVDFRQLEEINGDNVLGKTLKRIRESKSPNANAAFVEYAHSMSKLLWGNDNTDIKNRRADKAQAVLANKQVSQDKKQEIEVLKKHMNDLAMEHTALSNKLVKYPDQTGKLNSVRERIKELEYELENIRFQDSQVDKIYSGRKVRFVLFVATPIALVISYLLTVGVIFAFVFMEWDAWYKKVMVGLALFVLIILLSMIIYNRTKRFRKRVFGTPIPLEEHTENSMRMQEIEDELAVLMTTESECKANQAKYSKIMKERSDLEKKMSALEARYKQGVLISGQL